jgi:hypothetical protein
MSVQAKILFQAVFYYLIVKIYCANDTIIMDIFNETIVEIKAWFSEKDREGKVRYYDVTPLSTKANPAGEPPKRTEFKTSIILKEDTHLELGHPSVGSCSASLTTRDLSLVENNRITLLGPDIPEVDENALPFAQIVIACCRSDVANASSTMDRILHTSAQSDEYMIRSVPNLIWSRVSIEGARKGFSLHKLGSGLINSVLHECKDITGSEIFFATSCREDITALDKIVESARDKLRQFRTYTPMPDGTYECTTALDCDDCGEQPVCDSVRDVIKIRKGSRVITFGPEA